MLIIGVILGIFASICTNFGNIQQKYAFQHEITDHSNFWKNTRWLIGFSLTIIGSICDLIALANAAQSIVGPLAAFGLISNLFFAHWLLQEIINKQHILATVLIISGSTVSVLFGNHQSHTYTVDDLHSFFVHPIFLLYFFISTITLIFLYIQILKLNKQFDNITHSLNQLEAVINYLPYQTIHPLLICCICGFLGGFSILFGKIVSELVSSSVSLHSFQFVSFFAIISLVMLFVCIFFQQKTLAMALLYFDVSFVIPVFQCFFIMSTIFGGACFFQEFATLSVIDLILFLLGNWITLVGVFVLSLQSKSKLTHHLNNIVQTHSTTSSSINELAIFQ